MGQVLGQSPGPMANRDILNGHTQRQLILQPAQEAIPLTRDLPHFSGFAAIFSLELECGKTTAPGRGTKTSAHAV